jgi:hypothetical protein
MPTLREVAAERYLAQQALANKTSRFAQRTWRSLDPSDLSGSWERQAGSFLKSLAAAQIQAASGSVDYHRRAIAAEGGEVDFDGLVNPSAFGGVAADGRPLPSLFQLPVITAKEAIGNGDSLPTALRKGGAQFTSLASQQVRDAGRVADGLATFSNAHSIGYYRMLQGSSCPDCAILAGKWYARNAGFARHPHCDCVHVPVNQVDPAMETDVRAMVEAGKVTGLKDSERQAILEGADPARVVNSRRGMAPAGTTTRALAQRGQIRLTPEGIYRRAGSREEALQMLRSNGYLLTAPRAAPKLVPAKRIEKPFKAAAVAPSMSPQDAVREYAWGQDPTSGNLMYTKLNQALRKGEKLTDHQTDVVEGLDRAMDAVNPGDAPRKLHRMLANDRELRYQLIGLSKSKNAIWTDKAFASTSSKKDVVEDFIGDDSVRLEISLPKEFKALHVDEFIDENVPGAYAQSEWLLPRGTTFKIGEPRVEDGVTVIPVRVVSQTRPPLPHVA